MGNSSSTTTIIEEVDNAYTTIVNSTTNPIPVTLIHPNNGGLNINFQRPSVTLKLLRSAPIGTLIYIPIILDENFSPSYLFYTITSSDANPNIPPYNEFYKYININPLSGEVYYINKYLENSLILVIKVHHLLTNSTDIQTLTINFIDDIVFYNNPEFLVPQPSLSIYDDTQPGTFVFIPAIINTEGNPLIFEFDSGNNPNDNKYFSINSTNGEVYLIDPQQNLVKPQYNLLIKATDTFTKLHVTQAIYITNIKRIPPAFLPPTSVTIYNDTQPGTLVYGPNVSNSEGNPLIFEILSNTNDSNLFSINPTSGEVCLLTPVTTKSSYSFTMRVRDTITKLSVTQAISITNNERLGPKFYSPTIQLNTYEDAPDFTLVYGARVKTQKGSSLQFSFDISGNTATRNLNINDSSNFIIDSTTGEVRIIKSQSVTSTTAYNFKISVKDTITNLGDTQSLTITNNYGTPYFLDGPEMTITVYDDIDIANEIYIPNLNYTTDLIYNLLNDIFDNKYFYISDVSGHVFFKNQPSAEGIKQYTFQIKATNTINNKYATQQVLVNIKKRPQPPYFTDILYNIQINDPIELGKLIYKFTAVSPDNNKLRYDVIGDDNYEFNIDKFGQLTFENSPTVRDYHIKIKVTDLINSENVTSDNITIKVNNVSHFIGGENIIINIDDTYPDNSLIYTSKLIYKNVLGGITTYSYSINPGDDSTYFTITINQGQGQIYIKNTPNFNIKSTYKFQISGDYESRITDYIIRSNILLQNITVNVLQNENFTSCTQTPPDPPNLWSRATLSCVNYDVYSQEEFAMRQKAEVLKYKGNKNPLTKKQQFSRNVNGNGPLGKKVWATQNILGSNPNVFNLPQVGNTLILCPNNDTDNNNYTLSSTLIGNIDEFGRSVSISGDGNTLAISSFEEQTVYVYTKNINNTWSVAATLYEPTIDSFGSSLQLSYDGNTLITGAYLYPLYPIEYGRIYIYEKIASVWTQTFIFTGANTEQRLGKSVSISNDGSVIAVGSQYDNTTTYNGKIEVFERNGSHWNSAPPTYTLIATGLNFEQLSGEGLFLSGNGNFISATTDANKIYVYKKSGVSWSSGNTSQTLTISSDDNVYFDTNANYLCIGTLSGNIAYVYTYNTTTGLFEPQQLFNNLDGPSSTVIIISPDGKYTAIGMPIVNSNTGVVYIYKIINNTWNLIEKIYGDRINGLFGTSLSFNNDGSTLAIGASSYDAQAGKVYIYFRTL